MFKDLPELNTVVEKSTSIAIQTIEFQRTLFAETLKYFNDVTDKMFYTYTVKAAETVNSATEYAKENITTGQKKVANLFGNIK